MWLPVESATLQYQSCPNRVSDNQTTVFIIRSELSSKRSYFCSYFGGSLLSEFHFVRHSFCLSEKSCYTNGNVSQLHTSVAVNFRLNSGQKRETSCLNPLLDFPRYRRQFFIAAVSFCPPSSFNSAPLTLRVASPVMK